MTRAHREWYNQDMENNTEKGGNAAKIRQALLNFTEVDFAYLFGSSARGDTTQSSDIDVAVYINTAKGSDFFDIRLKLIEAITRATHKSADVTILNTASLFLKYVAIKEGIVLFERDYGQRVEFELKSTNEYFDYKPVIDLYREQLKNII